ncbi:MAG: histidinol-phosphate transaminase [Chloroflexi bacterium]|nr:histidinol-phosphate transaminase [Chloroflexota bacterium]
MPTINLNKLFRHDLEGLQPYAPSRVTISDMDRIIKLDANENPYGPSPKAMAALAQMRHWERYAAQDELRPALAQYGRVGVENIVVGNGADEVIDLVQRVFLDPGESIVDFPPTFEMYSQCAAVIGARVIEVPRRADFSLDIDAVERLVTQERPKLIFVANPNNPDGRLARRQDVERLLELPVVLVVDEAYAEFAGESLIERVPLEANLVVVRTFSKWAGLAGLRIGYCAAPAKIADQMLRIKPPYNVNAAAIVAAKASLEDADYLLGNVQRLIQERERLSWELAQVGYLEPLPSCTNFILCRVGNKSPLDLRNRLASQGILIRAYTAPQLREYVRISVGTSEQDDVLLQALKGQG